MPINPFVIRSSSSMVPVRRPLMVDIIRPGTTQMTLVRPSGDTATTTTTATAPATGGGWTSLSTGKKAVIVGAGAVVAGGLGYGIYKLATGGKHEGPRRGRSGRYR